MNSRIFGIFPQSFAYTTSLFVLCWPLGMSSTLSAAPLAVTRTPIVPLEQVQHVLIKTLALTERGLQDSSTLRHTVAEIFTQAGFTPVLNVNTPYDIMVQVKCEERKTRTGPGKHRKGGHSSASTSRLWKGPVCHISYRHQGKPALWSREVRTSFDDPRKAAKTAGSANAGLYALQALQTRLTQDPFPLYLAAEWRQTDRLIHLFHKATDRLDRRRLILQLLGPLTSPTALSTLEEATQNPELAATAIAALGDQGEIAIPRLAKVLDTSADPVLQLTALHALGEIATHSQAPALYDQFVRQLKSKDPRMQTVAVRGLGKLADQRASTPLATLNLEAWSNPSTHADIQALREALNWSLWQLDPDTHF